jgi:PAS domain S-box-containing protein
VTPHESHAVEVERLSRLYSALTHINQAIVRTHSRAELFTRVCEALTRDGGFRMAWIGWHDPETQRIVPLAQAGDENGYLDSIRVYADDRSEGRGTSGTAFRENQPCVRNDLLEDPNTLPWRDEMARRGFRAAVALPIRVNGEARGTLSVFADRRGFFRDKEIALLTEAASDISFALDNLAREEERARAEAIAQREERFANNLIEAMPGIFYLLDEQGRFLRWNRNFERVSGYSAEEITRMRPLQLFAADEKQFLRKRIASVFETGAASVEAGFVAKDGSTTPYFLTGQRIVFEGAPCLVGVGLDIAERKRAEAALSKSEERYRSTLDNILEGCQLLDFDWRYLYLNEAAAVHNRRPNAEMLGKRMPDVWPGIEASDVFKMLERCLRERIALHQEVEFQFPDGAKGWFDVRAQAVPEGVFVLSIDISERKRAALALRELNEGLERKVAERTRELEVARARAEAADRLKSTFLATMSHELRTPLNSIIGFTGILVQGMAGPLSPEQAKQLGMVQGSARHLLDLINDVLDISKIEAGQLEVRAAPFELLASVERVIASVTPLAAKKALSLRVVAPDTLPPVDSDRRRVEQILLNLLNNAIKFTDRGEITLRIELITAALSDGGGSNPVLKIQVEDTGIGMKEEDLSELFQPFRQIDAGLQRQHEGTGLGLAICRRLTGLLGGTIEARSSWGRGSVFTVQLPMSRARA